MALLIVATRIAVIRIAVIRIVVIQSAAIQTVGPVGTRVVLSVVLIVVPIFVHDARRVARVHSQEQEQERSRSFRGAVPVVPMHPVVPIGVHGLGADEVQDVLQPRSVEFLHWSQELL